MKIIVQKYGGTSVNTSEMRAHIIRNMQDAMQEGYSPVIVVSAMGRKPEPYSTDALLSLMPNPKQANPRHRDLLACCGEIITTVVVSEEIIKAGYEAIALTGGQAGFMTDTNYGEGKILKIDTARIKQCLQAGLIPVVAGFQGTSMEHEIVTLGRGGSDITATALAAALNAAMVEIYTDVDGVMSADPRVVKNAVLIDQIAYEDVFQLAEYGAKVIHPRAVEFAMEKNVPMAILNTKKGRHSHYTLITSKDKNAFREEMFNAVTSQSGKCQVCITTQDVQKEDNLFDLLAKDSISIDMVNIFPQQKMFIIDEAKKNAASAIMEKLGLDFTIKEGFCKITVLGNRISGVPGVVAKIISALYSNNIAVQQSSDSSTTVSVLVDEEQSHLATNVLHEALIGE